MIKFELTSLNGAIIPKIGLGTFGLKANAIIEAVRIGYRLIDTSDDYANESMIGHQLQSLIDRGEIKRDQMFLQTKISDDASYWDDPLNGVNFWSNSPFMHRHTLEEIIQEKVRNSKKRLKTDYLDSVLIHLPYPDYFVEMWDVLCSIKDNENIRYLGVSNFSERHFRLLHKDSLSPQINQTYFSPIGIRQSVCDYCNNNNIQLMTYSPLMDLSKHRLDFPIFQELSKKYGKTPSQIILRWNIERGSIPCPKSNHPNRLKENFEIMDFQLEKDDVKKISMLNYDFQYLPESKICPGI